MNNRVALILVAFLASGCDRVFGLHGAADGGTDAEPDGPLDPDAGPDGPCSPMTLLGDTFDVNSLPVNWPGSYTGNAADSFSVADGKVHLHVTSDSGYAIMDTPFYYDFRDQLFSMKFTDSGIAVDSVGGEVFRLTLTSAYRSASGINRTIVFLRYGDTIIAQASNDAGSPQTIGQKTYDPNDDAYVRFGVQGDSAVFDTSPNGTDWTNVGSVAYDHMDLVHPTFEVRHVTGDWEVELDEIMGGVPVGTVCDIDSLHDGFDAPVLASTWASSSFSPLSTVDLDNQDVHIHTADATGTFADNYFKAAKPYDLREGEVFFEMAQGVMPDPNKAFQLVIDGFGHNIVMQTVNGDLKIAYTQGAPATSTTLYDQVFDPANKWWKIGHTGNTTAFSIGPNGKDWTRLVTNSTIQAQLAASVYWRVYSASTADDVRIDNVNIAQP
ncbi:MAG TPA: hypothetical protein VGM90_02950 [Kofleriaceae bacterium]